MTTQFSYKHILYIVIAAIFAIGIFAFARREHGATNEPPSNISILFGWGSGRPHILFELAYDRDMIAVLIDSGLGSHSGLSQDYVFDALMVYGFVQNVPELRPALSDTCVINQDWIRKIIFREEVTLSLDQSETIFNLAKTVIRNKPNRAFSWAPVHGLPYAWVIIDGELYWSLLYSNIEDIPRLLRRYVNVDLLQMVDIIFDLPMQIWLAYEGY